MTNVKSLACLSTLLLLAACGDGNGGYYDANGSWIAPPNATTAAQRTNSPDPAMVDPYANPHYDRAGYYDYNGYYVDERDELNVPAGMMPPRGMCRVWFPDRAAVNQPRVEHCNGIRSRVPEGAYVIYGG